MGESGDDTIYGNSGNDRLYGDCLNGLLQQTAMISSTEEMEMTP
jgi:Ca2+-binding RTX toxin-like protein